MKKTSRGKPLLIAHRGDTINYPQNSIAAFESAFGKGADGIELDVQFQNNNLIVVHDYLNDRNKPYPLLPQVLELFSKRGRIEMEIKLMDLDFIPSLKQLLSTYKNSDFEITTSIFPLVSYLRKEFPIISLGVIFHEKEFEEWMTDEFIQFKIIQYMRLLKANVAHIPWKIVDTKIVEGCHQNRFKVHSHIYKQNLDIQTNIYREMKKLEIDQCTFDDILLLEKI